eukprot:3906964-Pyramimonas_sp.AAC.1
MCHEHCQATWQNCDVSGKTARHSYACSSVVQYGTSKGPLDAVWRQFVRGEALAKYGLHVLSILWDLRQFYEHLSHHRVWTVAKGHWISDCSDPIQPQPVQVAAQAILGRTGLRCYLPALGHHCGGRNGCARGKDGCDCD